MRWIAVLLFAACDSAAPPTVCDGHAELCARTYDQVAFPGTHDAYASVANGVYAHDQTYSLTRQMTDGVRVLHIEILPFNGSPWLCHGVCGLGGQSLVSALQEVKTFVDANPTEIVTLLTESSEITTDQIAADFDTADVKKYTHAHTLGDAWPTLGAMIERGERVVVFHADNSSSGGSTFDWMLDRFAWTWETPWDNETPVDFGRCDADRGTKGSSIYVVDTYLENLLVETPDNAALTNDDPFLVDRLLHCKQVEGVSPSFVMVNFYEVGDLFHVVDVLNGLAPEPSDDLSTFPPSSFDAGAD
ncbi:MAG TPA: hypothetical protein VGH87_11000 [Polyangiaceae bacterium]|jgi:hypothetical protein|nr:hypothetical protein [Polyangiaceae bacterium]